MAPPNCNPPCETLVALIERVQNLDHGVNGGAGEIGLKPGHANMQARVSQNEHDLENVFGRLNSLEIRLAKLIGWTAGAAAVGGVVGTAIALIITNYFKNKGW